MADYGRYFLFSGGTGLSEFGKGKGWEHFTGAFNTVEEAKSMLVKSSWYQVVDTTTLEIVEEGFTGSGVTNEGD